LFSIRPFSRVLTAWPRESIWFLPTSLCSWLRCRDVARPGFSRHQGAAHFVRRFSLSFAAVRPRSQLPQADLEMAFPVETFFLFPIFGAVRLSPPIFVPAWGFLSPRELGAGPISFSCWSSRSGVASLDSYSRPRFFSHRCRSDLIFRARVSAQGSFFPWPDLGLDPATAYSLCDFGSRLRCVPQIVACSSDFLHF
jgi:hypothetical protein